MEKQTFIFIGKSGSGKGTQAAFIRKFLEGKSDRQVFYMESGNKFREFISQSSHTASLSREIMKEGRLQPTFLAIHIWSHLMIEQMDAEKHFIIDGTPRKLEEAHILDGAIKFYGRGKAHVIYVNVSDTWAKERLFGRGRADDKEASEVEKRLAWFQEEVMPTVEYYRANSDYDFWEINGEQSIEEVRSEIETKLAKI